MRRVGFIAVASLALVALVAPGVAARQHHGSQSGTHHAAVGVTARTNTVVQGGQLHIQAKVKHAPRGAAFRATAVVHFHSGDVTINLRQRGHSFVALGTVSVSADETPGTVPVDVTVALNDVEQEVETDATVEDNPNDGTDDDATCDPATTTCSDDGDSNDGNDDDATCDPATTTCSDDGDSNDQGGDDQGDNSGGDGSDGPGGD